MKILKFNEKEVSIMNPEKKDTRSLAEIASEKIIQFIKENKLQPGDKLATEFELAERLNVGRSTVREAFKILASRNILEIKQGAGTFISPKRGIPNDPLGLTFIEDNTSLALDLLNVRLIFEPEMAVLATINATREQCKEIDAQCKKVEDVILANKDHREEDIQLHQLIATASGNKVISNLIPIIHSSVGKSIEVTTNTLRENARIYHRKIVEAIKSGDAQGARYAMIMHLNANREYIIEKNKIHS